MRSPNDLEPLTADARTALCFDLVDLLVALQQVDIDAVGLGNLRRATPYRQRQLQRWSDQWQKTAARHMPVVERVGEELARALPRPSPSADVLVHGDFRFGNVMVSAAARLRILALLDWELATIGEPLADLGYLGARMSAPAEVLSERLDPSATPGAPGLEELAKHSGLAGSVTARPASGFGHPVG